MTAREAAKDRIFISLSQEASKRKKEKESFLNMKGHGLFTGFMGFSQVKIETLLTALQSVINEKGQP